MESNLSLVNMNQQCRICLKYGDIHIWTYKVSLKPVSENDSFCVDDTIEKSFMDIIGIFSNSQDLLNLSEEFPLICRTCLEDLKFCYTIYEKIKFASTQLEDLYQVELNQCIEEEHLIEVVEENDITNTNLIETLQEEKILNIPKYGFHNRKHIATSKRVTLSKNDSFIVTQFIPETLEMNKNYISNELKIDENFRPPQRFFTLNLKAVEVTDLENLDRLDTSHPVSADITEPPVYICQYCPQAFAKSDYLMTHIQKSHVCKFCTQSFILTEDLFSHIRKAHTTHKCAICHKVLSSGTNLRQHIKRVHRVKLPAKVTLIDFIKSTSLEENKEDRNEIFEDEEVTDIDLNAQYVWRDDEIIKLLNENN